MNVYRTPEAARCHVCDRAIAPGGEFDRRELWFLFRQPGTVCSEECCERMPPLRLPAFPASVTLPPLTLPLVFPQESE